MGSIGRNMDNVPFGKGGCCGVENCGSMHVPGAGRRGILQFASSKKCSAAVDNDEDVREFFVELGNSILAAKAQHGKVDAVFLQRFAGGAGRVRSFLLERLSLLQQRTGGVMIHLLSVGNTQRKEAAK